MKGSHRIVLGIHGSDFPGSEIGCFEPGNVFQDCLFTDKPLGRENLSALTSQVNLQNLLTRRDVVTDRQICLLWDRNVVEPGELFFLGCSTIAAAHKL
jgi:hypothetical protein